nr:DUF2057 domain-containing protein [Vibrio sp. Of7-15]
MVSFSSQAIEVEVGENIEFMVANGKEVGSLMTPAKTLDLPQGKHQLVVRYNASVKDGSRNKFFTSRPYIFEADIQQATVINLPKMKRYSQVESHFQSGPKWTFEYQDGTSAPVSYDKLVGSGFSPYGDMEGLVAEYNKERGISFTNNQFEKLTDVAVSVSDTGEVNITGDATTQLKLWYTKATAEERKTFKLWMVEQDM